MPEENDPPDVTRARPPAPPPFNPPPHNPPAAAPWGQAPPPSGGFPAPPPYRPQPNPPSGPPPPSPAAPPSYSSSPAGLPSYGVPYRPTVPYGPPGGGPPPRRSGLFVGLLAALAVGLVAVIVLGVLVWSGRDDDPDEASDGNQDPSSEAADPSTDDGSGPDTSSAPSSPSSPTPSEPEPSPSEPEPSPSEPEPPRVDPTSAFSYTEYGDDWDFRYGDVKLKADFKQGWDYDSCGPVENAGALTDIGCKAASQWTYRALGGDLALSHLVLTMGSEKQAKKAIEQELIKTDSWKAEDAAILTARDGAWRANSQGVFIVLTFETHEPSVKTAQAQKYLKYANADILGALAFRF